MITEQNVAFFAEKSRQLLEEISKDMIGQKDVVENAVIAMIAGGNVLLEGVPGVGKTRLVRSMGQVFSLPFSRIQFTPDLMPADVTGTNIIEKDDAGRNVLKFQKGPIFSNIILADEINLSLYWLLKTPLNRMVPILFLKPRQTALCSSWKWAFPPLKS